MEGALAELPSVSGANIGVFGGGGGGSTGLGDCGFRSSASLQVGHTGRHLAHVSIHLRWKI